MIELDTPEGNIHYVYNNLNQHTETWTGTGSSPTSATTDTTYGYDNLGRLSSVVVSKLNGSTLSTVLTTHYYYDADGNKAAELDPNGVTTTYTYDGQNRLTNEVQKNSSNVTLYSVTYTLNSDGSRHSASETEAQPTGSPATITSTWTYDNLDRLTGETIASSLSGQSFSDVFTYDLVGNRLREDISGGSGITGGSSIFYTYNGDNQLKTEYKLQFGSSSHVYDTTYFYDNNGSLTSSVRTGNGAVTDTYSYDLRNRMTSATIGGVTTYYIYRDDGIRVSETTGTTTTTYLIDDNNPTGYAQTVEEHVNGSSTPSVTYFIGQTIYGQANGTSILTLLRDGHGNTRLVASSTGTILAAYNYDAFANPNGFTFASALTTHLTADGSADVATSFEYQDARFRSGFEWTQMDSITQTPGDLLNANLYVYLGGNPINGIDPTGHDVDIAEETVTSGGIATLAAILIPIALTLQHLFTSTEPAQQAESGSLPPITDTYEPDEPAGKKRLFRAPREDNPDPALEVKFGFNPTLQSGKSAPAGVYFGTSFSWTNEYYRETDEYWNGIQAVYLPISEFNNFVVTHVLISDIASYGNAFYVPINELPIFNAAVIAGAADNHYYPESVFEHQMP